MILFPRHRRHIIALFIFMLFVISACAPKSATLSAGNSSTNGSQAGTTGLRARMVEIEQHIKKGQFAQALEQTEALIREQDSVPVYHLLKAKILKDQGKKQVALDYLTQQIKDHPENAGLIAARGQFLLENGHIESARQDFLLAYKHNYRSVDILKVLSVIEKRNGNLVNAIGMVAEALKLAPEDHELWFEKAQLELRTRQLIPARKSVGKAIRLSEGKLKYHQLYLEILGYQKDNEAIRQHIPAMVEIFPDEAWVSIRYATLLYTRHEQAKARAVLAEAIRKHPRDYLLLFHAATISAAEKNWEESIMLLQAGLKVKPDSTWAMVQLSKIYFQTKQNKKGVEYLQRARAAKSRDPFVYEALAKLYNRQNDTFEAEEIILEGLAINRKNQHLILEYAGLLEKRANYKEAIKAYEKALVASPDDYVILGKLGNLHRLLSHYDQSNSYFLRSLQQKPDAIWVRSYYVELLTDLEDWEAALAEIDKILAQTSTDYWAYTKKAQIENELERFQEANASIKQAIKLRPDARWLKEIEANSLENLKRYQDAEASFQTALKEDSDNAYLLTRLGYVQLHINQGWARRSIEKALESEDFDIATIELYLYLTGQSHKYWGFKKKSPESRIHSLIIHKQFDEAEKLMAHPNIKKSVHYPFLSALSDLLKKDGRPILSEEAECARSTSSWHCFYMGIDAMRKEEWIRARQAFQNGLSKNPENVWLMIKLAYVDQHLQEYVSAIELLEGYLEKRPSGSSDTWVKLRLALNFDLSQQYEKAEAVYEGILKADPLDNVALNNLAWMYLTAKNSKMHKLDVALKLALQAVKISPSPANLDTLAEAYYQKKEYRKALKIVEQALDRDRRGLDDFKKTKKKILKAIESSKKK